MSINNAKLTEVTKTMRTRTLLIFLKELVCSISLDVCGSIQWYLIKNTLCCCTESWSYWNCCQYIEKVAIENTSFSVMVWLYVQFLHAEIAHVTTAFTQRPSHLSATWFEPVTSRLQFQRATTVPLWHTVADALLGSWCVKLFTHSEDCGWSFKPLYSFYSLMLIFLRCRVHSWWRHIDWSNLHWRPVQLYHYSRDHSNPDGWSASVVAHLCSSTWNSCPWRMSKHSLNFKRCQPWATFMCVCVYAYKAMENFMMTARRFSQGWKRSADFVVTTLFFSGS